MNANTNKRTTARVASLRRLLAGGSLITLGVLLAPAAALAQTNTQAQDPETTEVEEVIVTGIRASLQSAQSIKQNADQVVDSITASDIGALPDRSVTEAVQRIPGVTIDRLQAREDPDRFSAEGSGVQVRGLTQVRQELNGRDSLGALDGRGLGFEDVPAELMAGVDVYKNPSAELIEGGLGGTVNLRTRMPFDSTGRLIAGSLSGNYSDHAEEWKPQGSVLFSDRFETGAGEVGFLANLAYSELASRADGIQVSPYRARRLGDDALCAGRQNPNGDPYSCGQDWIDESYLGLTAGETLYVPEGISWRRLDSERERLGGALALQWRPNDQTEFYAQYMRSQFDTRWDNYEAIPQVDAGNNFVIPAGGGDFTFGDDGYFQSGTLRQISYWRGSLPVAGELGTQYRMGARHQEREESSNDFSVGVRYFPSDKLSVSADLQYIKSTSAGWDFTLYSSAYIPDVTIDLTGERPVADLGPSAFTSDPANYFWNAAMDHIDDNEAEQFAARVDLAYTFDDQVLKSLRVGARFADREVTNNYTQYNWQVLSAPWNEPFLWMNTTLPQYATVYTFENFFRGDAQAPTVVMPDIELARGYLRNSDLIENIGGNAQWGPRGFDAETLSAQTEQTFAGYAMLRFGWDDARVPVEGNVGFRVVRTENTASGSGFLPDLSSYTSLPAADLAFGTGAAFDVSGGQEYTDVLPSLNLKFQLTDSLIARFAASKAIARPSFNQMFPFVDLTASVNQPGTMVEGWGGEARGNPNLKPMRANQFDVALEWYFSRSDSLYVTAFRKDVEDFFTTGVHTRTFEGRNFLVTGPTNGDEGRIQGFEVGYQQFYDFLPGLLGGLGLQANFTYIDSEGSTNQDYVSEWDAADVVTGLPLEGLSETSYNLVGLYQRGPMQARLAYNWRGKYLLTNRDVSDVRLPMWQDDYGQLDGSVIIALRDNVSLALEGNNLANTENKQLMGDQALRTRSWWIYDRRFAVTLRASF
jgi:TonB-dependent receptor